MTVRLGVLVLVVAAGTVAHSQSAAQRPIFRASADAVRIDVAVTTRDGSRPPALPVSAFEVLDNGRVQPIVTFSAAPQPVTLSIVLDLSDSTMHEASRLESAVLALSHALSSEDMASVGSLWQYGPLRQSPTELARDLSHLRLHRESHIWYTLEHAASVLRPLGGRRAILVATDGLDNGDWIATNVDIPAPLKPLFLSGIRDGLNYRGLDDDAIQLHVVQIGRGRIANDLRALSEGTGGRVIDGRGRASLDTIFTSVLDELRHQYLLAFVPPDKDGAVHRLVVRVTPPTLRVRHRGAYVAVAGQ